MSELGLVERINREICHPLGLAISRNPETGFSEWISVKDQLPEVGDHCLFLIPTSIPYVVAGFVEESDYRFQDCSVCDQYGDCIGYSADCISHWMPLPEPPKGLFKPT